MGTWTEAKRRPGSEGAAVRGPRANFGRTGMAIGSNDSGGGEARVTPSREAGT